MHFFKVVCDDNLYLQSKNYFLVHGRSGFLSKSRESLCARFVLAQHMKNLGYVDFVPEDGVYSYQDVFFSFSHSHGCVFGVIADRVLAVDIEKIKHRDLVLLDTVSAIPSCTLSSWEQFYLQWSAKECLIKYLNLDQEKMDTCVISDFEISDDSCLGKNTWKLTLGYNHHSFVVQCTIQDGFVLAVLI